MSANLLLIVRLRLDAFELSEDAYWVFSHTPEPRIPSLLPDSGKGARKEFDFAHEARAALHTRKHYWKNLGAIYLSHTGGFVTNLYLTFPLPLSAHEFAVLMTSSLYSIFPENTRELLAERSTTRLSYSAVTRLNKFPLVLPPFGSEFLCTSSSSS